MGCWDTIQTPQGCSSASFRDTQCPQNGLYMAPPISSSSLLSAALPGAFAGVDSTGKPPQKSHTLIKSCHPPPQPPEAGFPIPRAVTGAGQDVTSRQSMG